MGIYGREWILSGNYERRSIRVDGNMCSLWLKKILSLCKWRNNLKQWKFQNIAPYMRRLMIWHFDLNIYQSKLAFCCNGYGNISADVNDKTESLRRMYKKEF